MIVKTDCETDGSSAALDQTLITWVLSGVQEKQLRPPPDRGWLLHLHPAVLPVPHDGLPRQVRRSRGGGGLHRRGSPVRSSSAHVLWHKSSCCHQGTRGRHRVGGGRDPGERGQPRADPHEPGAGGPPQVPGGRGAGAARHARPHPGAPHQVSSRDSLD